MEPVQLMLYNMVLFIAYMEISNHKYKMPFHNIEIVFISFLPFPVGENNKSGTRRKNKNIGSHKNIKISYAKLNDIK